MKLLLVIIFLASNVVWANRLAPTVKVNSSIKFADDLNFKYLNLAIKRQLQYFDRADLSVKFKLGSKYFSRKDLKLTLEHFQSIMQKTVECQSQGQSNCSQLFNELLNREFDIYRPLPGTNERGHATGKSLFTAYYSPDLQGSKTKNRIYKYPIYALPENAKDRKLTRCQIDFQGKLAGKGLELFYVKEHPYDIWLLHVEGGGRVVITDDEGNKHYHHLSYAGSNKRSFRMLYKYMLEHGMLQSGQTSIYHQRKYLMDNPQHLQDVLCSSPSYIFFKVTTEEPLGVKNIPLTQQRSLATDYRIYKEYGLLNFIQATRPQRNIQGELEMHPFSRFFINQDTGGAIRGNARSDLYFGYGPQAQTIANNLKHLGDQYFLIKKSK